MDLGMCHCIHSEASVAVSQRDSGGECVFLINGKGHDTLESACSAIFGGHYSCFLTEFYQEMGVEQP